MKTLLLSLLALPLLSGCAAFGVHKVIRELAQDPATLRLRVPTPYGLVELDRTNPQPGLAPHDLTNSGIHVGEAGVAGLQSGGPEIIIPLRLQIKQ